MDIQLQGFKWHTVSAADAARMQCNFGTKDQCSLKNTEMLE